MFNFEENYDDSLLKNDRCDRGTSDRKTIKRSYHMSYSCSEYELES